MEVRIGNSVAAVSFVVMEIAQINVLTELGVVQGHKCGCGVSSLLSSCLDRKMWAMVDCGYG